MDECFSDMTPECDASVFDECSDWIESTPADAIDYVIDCIDSMAHSGCFQRGEYRILINKALYKRG